MPNGFATAFHTAQGVDPAQRGLQARPDTRSTTAAPTSPGSARSPSTEGIRLLLADSTNAEEPGYTGSERSVGESLRRIFPEPSGAVGSSSPASRATSTASSSSPTPPIANGRKVALLGRSMLQQRRARPRARPVARSPDRSFVDIEEVDDLNPGEVCVISTGSQGEPMSALALLASGENRRLRIERGRRRRASSSHAIPGNEWAVAKVMDGLARRGAEVIHSGVAYVHESGHAKPGRARRPCSRSRGRSSFIPVHGEYRHLLRHARLAIEMGVARTRCCSARTATSFSSATRGSTSTARCPRATSSSTASSATSATACCATGGCSPRRASSSSWSSVDSRSGELVAAPEIMSRGFLDEPGAEAVVDELRSAVVKAIEVAVGEGAHDPDTLRRVIRRTVGRIVSERTRRRPMIVPLVLEA